MKLSEFRKLVRKAVNEYQANNPQKSPAPSKPGPGIAPAPDKNVPTRKPGTNPGKFPRPNVDPAPAKAIKEKINEIESSILNKIVQRFNANKKNG
jgi:hypothetical protein